MIRFVLNTVNSGHSFTDTNYLSIILIRAVYGYKKAVASLFLNRLPLRRKGKKLRRVYS